MNSTYRYYLAFEHFICDGYISEKFFENFNYDIIQVVRGGNPNTQPIDIKDGAYINSNKFKTAHELGKYLRNLSKDINMYAGMLKTKDEYRSVPYIELFKDFVCDICKRLSNMAKYRYVYEDIHNWMKNMEPCFKPHDLP